MGPATRPRVLVVIITDGGEKIVLGAIILYIIIPSHAGRSEQHGTFNLTYFGQNPAQQSFPMVVRLDERGLQTQLLNSLLNLAGESGVLE